MSGPTKEDVIYKVVRHLANSGNHEMRRSDAKKLADKKAVIINGWTDEPSDQEDGPAPPPPPLLCGRQRPMLQDAESQPPQKRKREDNTVKLESDKEDMQVSVTSASDR